MYIQFFTISLTIESFCITATEVHKLSKMGVQHTSQSRKNLVDRAISLKCSITILNFTPIYHKNAETTLLYKHTRDIVKTTNF